MRFCLLATMALVLCACGDKPDEPAATNATPARAVVAPADDSVAAAKVSPGTPVAQLRFVLGSRPVAGRPFNLQLVVSGSTAPQLRLSTESAMLRIEPATTTLELDGSGTGAARVSGGSHDFEVVGAQEGLAELTVRLVADDGAPETVYVIPVMVAAPGAPSDKADPSPAGDDGKPKKG